MISCFHDGSIWNSDRNFFPVYTLTSKSIGNSVRYVTPEKSTKFKRGEFNGQVYTLIMAHTKNRDYDFLITFIA